MTHATTWINLETFVQSERSQTQKMPRIVQFSFPEISRIAKSIEKILHLQEGKHIVRVGGKQQKIEVTVPDGFYISVIWEA